ncbi:MAG: DUF2798 domain-containing protein [Xanthobacteraceae bacterium]|nr:DUF2798 domain-containing protein [Xanthobacteraceae bacterium]
MQKLPPRFAHILVPLLLTFIVTAMVSAISTILAVGVNFHAVQIWPRAWMASWMAAFPVALFILPFARWAVGFVVRRE